MNGFHFNDYGTRRQGFVNEHVNADVPQDLARIGPLAEYTAEHAARIAW